jgi:adenine-specific DNA-methyltransferase
MKDATRNVRLSPAADEVAETFRLDAIRQMDAKKKSELGQFFTPLGVARLMASMGVADADTIRILDAGAGVGSLFSAVVHHLCGRTRRPRKIRVTAYELDETLSEPLHETARTCGNECRRLGVSFSSRIVIGDFLEAAADMLEAGFFPVKEEERFDLAILNPPYHKIHSQSKTRKTLRQMGVETSNIYTGFLAGAVKLLKTGGEMIAITPRSFCNGTYFRAFRRWFLNELTLRSIHSFHSREEAFRDDDVLQEIVIFCAQRGATCGQIVVSSSTGPDDPASTSRVVDYERIVRPDDPQHFIRILTDELADQIAERMGVCRTTLFDLGLTVSTGRVVDFRAREYLRKGPGEGTVPLIWPAHFERGYIAWPKNGSSRKPEAIMAHEAVADQLVPNEPYVLVRRFSAKEERRRVVAAVHDPKRLSCENVGFENHLNYFHRNGGGIGMKLARGLAAFLNSTIVDLYFRQFSGHTQVNATDLRSMRYPSREQLERMGGRIGREFPDQTDVDVLVAHELFGGDCIVATLHQHVMKNGTSQESLPS